MGVNHIVAGDIRRNNDYYPTPPFVGVSLLEELASLGIVVGSRILEPAAGRGHLALGLRDRAVVSCYDLNEYPDPLVHIKFGVDCLSHDYSEYDAVITNPPYVSRMPEKIIQKYLKSDCRLLALLVRSGFIYSQRRLELFTDHPPTFLMPYSSRIKCYEESMDNPIGGFIDYSWIVWYRNAGTIPTSIRWVDTKKAYKRWLGT